MDGPVLIVKPSSLGDVVHTLPALSRLRAALPAATPIDWVVNPEWEPVLAGHPALRATRLFPRGDFRGVAGMARFVRWLRHTPRRWGADTALDFQGLLRSALVARAARPRRILGLADAREGATAFYHRAIPLDGAVHAVERYLRLADAFLAEALPGDLSSEDHPSRGSYRSYTTHGTDGPAAWHLPLGDPTAIPPPAAPFVVLHPFSRGEGKSLAPGQIAELCRFLAPRPVVLVGKSTQSLPTWPANVVGFLNQTTLLQLVWLLRRAAFVVSVDSGPMHLAAALNDRLIGLHTWTDPRKVGPYRDAARVWKAGALVRMDELVTMPDEWFRSEERPDTAAMRVIAAAVRAALDA